MNFTDRGYLKKMFVVTMLNMMKHTQNIILIETSSGILLFCD